jgi:hypothetical protein
VEEEDFQTPSLLLPMDPQSFGSIIFIGYSSPRSDMLFSR